MDKNKNEKKIVFISYLDDSGDQEGGYFYVLEQNESYVKFKTSVGNILTIPMHRVLKIKEVPSPAVADKIKKEEVKKDA